MSSLLGEHLKKVRISLNMTVREAAKDLGISPAYLSNIENKVFASPSEKLLFKIADWYGEDITVLKLLSCKHPKRSEEDGLM